MDIIKIAGLVSDLEIFRGRDSLIFDNREKSAIGVGAVAAAAFQESLSSTSMGNLSASDDIEMEFFTCTVGGRTIKGSFYKVGFENGQYIEFAISQNAGGEVLAACDPLKHLIWTRPHRTKGYLAQRASNIAGSITISIISAMMLFFAEYFSGEADGPVRMQSAIYQGCLSFVLMMALSFFVCRKIYGDLIGTTLIFDALGFSDPSRVNLPKIHRQAKKIFYKELESEETENLPWRFRYTENYKKR